ncbi:hypothetical protein EYR36_001975 [Pleurotus pulmonarius]|nr:hypothetical protein EYR36_001975 [Pleurotus pulmonarius]KAF4588132.1 hypothetical protein EYR38_010097 [Pleurotus pulmonarius]KAF4588274.1 hypothetical protein EYR38_010241 [Pleurotus pulmonarius]KAF4603183.1 hypothetical protein EYR38_003593 [Pleurotus pulmonarius]
MKDSNSSFPSFVSVPFIVEGIPIVATQAVAPPSSVVPASTSHWVFESKLMLGSIKQGSAVEIHSDPATFYDSKRRVAALRGTLARIICWDSDWATFELVMPSDTRPALLSIPRQHLSLPKRRRLLMFLLLPLQPHFVPAKQGKHCTTRRLTPSSVSASTAVLEPDVRQLPVA